MYYESYEDYMRDSQGYPNMNANPYYNNRTYPNQYQFRYAMPEQQPAMANNLYPELYSEIRQKIESNCIAQDCRMTEENVERITEQVYADYKDKTMDNTKQAENRRNQNSIIRDLIRIIVIKHLLSRQRSQSPFQMMPQMPMQNNYGLY